MRIAALHLEAAAAPEPPPLLLQEAQKEIRRLLASRYLYLAQQKRPAPPEEVREAREELERLRELLRTASRERSLAGLPEGAVTVRKFDRWGVPQGSEEFEVPKTTYGWDQLYEFQDAVGRALSTMPKDPDEAAERLARWIARFKADAEGKEPAEDDVVHGEARASLEGWPYLRSEDPQEAWVQLMLDPSSGRGAAGQFSGSSKYDDPQKAGTVFVFYGDILPYMLKFYDNELEQLDNTMSHEMGHAAQHLIKRFRSLRREVLPPRKTHMPGYDPHGQPIPSEWKGKPYPVWKERGKTTTRLPHALRPVEAPNIPDVIASFRRQAWKLPQEWRKSYLLALLDGEGGTSPHYEAIPSEAVGGVPPPFGFDKLRLMRDHNPRQWRWAVTHIFNAVRDMLEEK